MRTTRRGTAVFLSLAAILAGCSSAHEERTLAGTSWQLVTIESSDDEQGSTAVPDPTKFTVEFGTDDKAFFQLDCNRGNGGYTVEPSADGSGSVSFGPIATTMMLCPQPSLDQEVATALSNVAGYLFQDDRLHLSLKADGGILTWKPAP